MSPSTQAAITIAACGGHLATVRLHTELTRTSTPWASNVSSTNSDGVNGLARRATGRSRSAFATRACMPDRCYGLTDSRGPNAEPRVRADQARVRWGECVVRPG